MFLLTSSYQSGQANRQVAVGSISTSQAISKMQTAVSNVQQQQQQQTSRRSNKSNTSTPTRNSGGGGALSGSAKGGGGGGEIDDELKQKIIPVLVRISDFLKNNPSPTSNLSSSNNGDTSDDKVCIYDFFSILFLRHIMVSLGCRSVFFSLVYGLPALLFFPIKYR